jgi:hypothetical protein
MRLADKYSPEQLEAACVKALSYTPYPSIKTIQAILKSNLINAEDKTPPAPKTLGLTRGADYYRREK